MGTNYYLKKESDRTGACPMCGHEMPDKSLHIGKKSAGWPFLLHVIPNKSINTLNDWQQLWNQRGYHIVDEYGRETTRDEMLQVITGGTNIRFRNTVDHVHCVGYGDGPWDLIVGDFS